MGGSHYPQKKLKNTKQPFYRGELAGATGHYALLDWIVNKEAATNGNTRDSDGLAFFIRGWIFPQTEITNGKMYQTIELEAGTYIFRAIAPGISNPACVSRTFLVAAVGDRLPDENELDAQALAFGTFPVQTGLNYERSIEFALSETTTVTLGFLTTLTSAMGNCLVSINEVELKHKKFYPLTGIQLNKSDLLFTHIGVNEKLIPIIEPDYATNQAVSWSSNNETVATVASDGTVTARATGTATITAKTLEGGLEATCKVTVIQAVTRYRNPVIRQSVPDPTLLRVSDGSFYLYATEDIRNVPIFHSYDLVNWTFKGTAFTNVTRPYFEPGGGIWAPDINYINGKYVMYYSMSVWGGGTTCGIGVAVADSPQGPFADRGALFRSTSIGVLNSIDPNYVEDNGKKYLFWGSWNGIWGIELTEDGLNLKEGNFKQQIAGTAYEAAYIHKRGNYYYLIASIGSCCNGLSSTYTTVVGRSQNLFGPYLNKSGLNMMQNNHTVLINKNSSFVGTGHNSQIVKDNAGNDWILYHGYSVANNTGRNVLLDIIIWENDWPTIPGGTPSIEADVPFF